MTHKTVFEELSKCIYFATDALCKWLEKTLPDVGGAEWWQSCVKPVIDKRDTDSRKRDKEYESLQDFDLDGLLGITLKNRKLFGELFDERWEASLERRIQPERVVRGMFDVRNHWAHFSMNNLFDIETYNDVKTIIEFLCVVDAEKEYIASAKCLWGILDLYGIDKPEKEYEVYDDGGDKNLRYMLGTKGKKTLVCLGVTPSKATKSASDRTISLVERIAEIIRNEKTGKDNVFDSFLMLNIYPRRISNLTGDRFPQFPDKCDEALAEKNKGIIEKYFEKHRHATVWLAYGDLSGGSPKYLTEQCEKIFEILNRAECKYVCREKLTDARFPQLPTWIDRGERLIECKLGKGGRVEVRKSGVAYKMPT